VPQQQKNVQAGYVCLLTDQHVSKMSIAIFTPFDELILMPECGSICLFQTKGVYVMIRYKTPYAPADVGYNADRLNRVFDS